MEKVRYFSKEAHRTIDFKDYEKNYTAPRINTSDVSAPAITINIRGVIAIA